VNTRTKYLNALVLLTFLVGQVQYAYSSYFCSMKQTPVKSPIMAMNSLTDNSNGICRECQSVIPSRLGQLMIGSNCIKVIKAEKSVVSNFTQWAKFNSRVDLAFDLMPAFSNRQSSGASGYKLFTPANSPPIDLPILNNNLRI